MEFRFETIEYDRSLPVLPKHSGVYKIFDIRDKLIVLDKTSNLFERFERYYGERSERVRDLDLREITGRIEFIRTDSTFETLYVLYRERKRHFPKRSEEHTSELQSPCNLVCRLLLEKKKKKHMTRRIIRIQTIIYRRNSRQRWS